MRETSGFPDVITIAHLTLKAPKREVIIYLPIYLFSMYRKYCILSLFYLSAKLRKKRLIAPLSDIRMVYIRYLTMHKVHMHAGAIKQLLYGCAHVQEVIHSLKLVDYLPLHTHTPYNNLHILTSITKINTF